MRKVKEMAGSITMWGPMVWQGLHDMSAFYITERHECFMDLLLIIPSVLPCAICRMNARGHMRPFLKILHSRCSVVDYMDVIISLHNEVSLDKYDVDEAVVYPAIPQTLEVLSSSTERLLEMIRNHSRCRKIADISQFT